MIWLKCAVATLIVATLCASSPTEMPAEGDGQGERGKRTLILGVLFKNLLLQQALGRNLMLNGTILGRPQGMGSARPQAQTQSEAPPPPAGPSGPPAPPQDGPSAPQQGPSAPEDAPQQQEQAQQEAASAPPSPPPQQEPPPQQGPPAQQGPPPPPPQVPVSTQGASPLQQLTLSQPPPAALGLTGSRLPSLSVYGPPQGAIQQGSVFPPNFPFGIQGFRQLPFGPAPPLGAQAGPQAGQRIFPFGVFQFPAQGPTGSFVPTGVSASGGQFGPPPSGSGPGSAPSQGAPQQAEGPPTDAGQGPPPPPSAPAGEGAPQSSAAPPPTQSSPESDIPQVPPPPQASPEPPQSGPGDGFQFGTDPSAQPGQGPAPGFSAGSGPSGPPSGPPSGQAGPGGNGPPPTGFGGDASQGSLPDFQAGQGPPPDFSRGPGPSGPPPGPAGPQADPPQASLQDFLRLLQQGGSQGPLPSNFPFGPGPAGAQGAPPQQQNFQFNPSGPDGAQQSTPSDQPNGIPSNLQLGPLDNNLQQQFDSQPQQQPQPTNNNQPPPPSANGFPSNLGDFQLANGSPQTDQRVQTGLFDPSQFSGSDNNVFDFPQQGQPQSNDNQGQQQPQQPPQQSAFPNNFPNGLFTAPGGEQQQQFDPAPNDPQPSSFNPFNGQQFDFGQQFPQGGGGGGNGGFQNFPQNFF